MNLEIFINIVGYAAAICMIFGYLPQAIRTIRTRDTDGIALPTFLMLGLGSVLFVVQGALLGNIPLVITNSITTICSVIVFGIKVHNDRKKRRAR
ncbi:MAG: SemiSWEET family transporter [Bacteroidales bacterium]|nr:SemiSWEET family transporter [Bacteroidales bacterium]